MTRKTKADLAPDPRPAIIVVGYPKSGNTWMSRLLGSALNAPVGGAHNAVPLCTEGLDRKGEFKVMQLHLHPNVKKDDRGCIQSAMSFGVPYWTDERLVYVIRDPRDVAVSVRHYWNLPTLKDAVKAMINGSSPLGGPGPWDKYVEKWLDVLEGLGEDKKNQWAIVKYGWLKSNTERTLSHVLGAIGLGNHKGRVKPAVSEQSFAATRRRLAQTGANRPYGRTVQLRNLRKGVSGDWRNHFTKETGKMMEEAFGPLMERIACEDNLDWWRSL